MSANTTNTANKIIYPLISYEITGIAFKVQNEMGRFCKEKQYAKAFEEELKNKGIKYKREYYAPVSVNGKKIGSNWIDFLIESKEGAVVVDLKAKPLIERQDYYQIQRYLELKKVKLGLIINFQSKYLKPKRVLNSRYSQNSRFGIMFAVFAKFAV